MTKEPDRKRRGNVMDKESICKDAALERVSVTRERKKTLSVAEQLTNFFVSTLYRFQGLKEPWVSEQNRRCEMQISIPMPVSDENKAAPGRKLV